MNRKKLVMCAPLFFALTFLIAIPFNIRKVFNFEKIQHLEGFKENISFSLFGFDIALLLFLLAVFGISYYSKKKLFPEKISPKEVLKNPLTLLIIWVFLSIFWASNLETAFYMTLRVFSGILASLLLKRTLRFNRRTFIYATSTIFTLGVVQSVIGILQFFNQKSIGLKYLGESKIANSILGVAKFEVAGTKIIRAYGTFPHPNLFGAFLLLALTAGIWLFLFVDFPKKSKVANIIIPSSLAIILTGIAVSYSRGVILVLGVMILITILAHKKKFISIFKQTCERIKIPRTLQGAIAILVIFSGLFLSYNILSPRMCFMNCKNDNSIDLRFKYIKTATSVITEKPLCGTGIGNFTIFQKENFSKKIKPWEQQPVHNIYLLIASEIGLIGFTLFMYLLVQLTDIFKKGFFGRLHNPFVLCFFGFLLLGLVDHYFWTLPQGLLIFWVSLAFFHSSAKITRVEKLKKS